MEMKFSIVVPVYNAEKSLERCIKSIEEQQLLCQLEIILVEDYSQDNSLECCHQLSKEYNNIIVVQTNGKGVSDARNTGLAYASGDIIGFCDSDDEYEIDTLEKIRRRFEEDMSIDIISGGFFYSQIKEGVLSIEESHYYRKEKIVNGRLLYNLILNDPKTLGSVCNKFYRRELLEENHFPKELSYCEDLYFNAKIVDNYPSVCCLILNEPIYHYVRNISSATNSTDKLFNSNSEYKYSVTLKKLYYEEKDHNYRNIVGYKIVTLAIDFLYHNEVSFQKKQNLMKDIKMFRNKFMAMLFYNMHIGSLKWFTKYILILIKRN